MLYDPLFIEELFHVVKSGGNYLPSIRIIVCNLAVPFAGQYGILVVLISLQFMVANRIIQIKQKHILSNINIVKLFDQYRHNVTEDMILQKISKMEKISWENFGTY